LFVGLNDDAGMFN